jgi:hypothetical protein
MERKNNPFAKLVIAVTALSITLITQAQVTDPIITTWKLNTTNHMVNGILTDVQDVHYTTSNVYVHTSGVPSYYDFNNVNVNDASDGNFTFNFPRVPQQNTGTATSSLGGGQMGVFIDGDMVFNAEDARSYQNANIWHQLAYFFEAVDFDSSGGHSTPTNQYHHHIINLALADTSNSSVHSPIIGWMFDGYPLYGPFGYSDPTDANSGVVRMKSSYVTGNYTTRTTYADGTTLQPSQYGPNVSQQYPIGCYREDYIYSAGSGTLDEHNGRFCKTPEFPNGIYAYFCTLDSNNTPTYPFTIGQSYYGIVTQGNQGPMGGHNVTIPGNATLYVPTSTAINEALDIDWHLYPNPTANTLFVQTNAIGDYYVQVVDISGSVLLTQNITQSVQCIDMSGFSAGTYLINITDQATGKHMVNRCVKL